MSPARTKAEVSTPLLAIISIIGATLCFTALDTAAKVLVVQGASPIFVAWARFGLHAVVVMLFLRAWMKPAVFGWKNPWMQILRGLCTMSSGLMTYQALKTLQLAEVSAILFAGPMVVTALAGPMLGEWAGWRRWLAVIAGFIGVLIVVQPGFQGFALGQIYALGAMLFYSIFVLLTRRLGATESAESLLLYAGLVPFLALIPLQPYRFDLPQMGWEWALVLVTGVFGMLGHMLVIKAYKLASPAAVAPYSYLQLLWSVTAGYVVFSQLPNVWTIAGSAVIVASGLYILHRERQLRMAGRSALSGEVAPLAKKL